MRAERQDRFPFDGRLFEEGIHDHRAVAPPVGITEVDDLISGEVRQSPGDFGTRLVAKFLFRDVDALVVGMRIRFRLLDLINVRSGLRGDDFCDLGGVSLRYHADRIIFAGVGEIDDDGFAFGYGSRIGGSGGGFGGASGKSEDESGGGSGQ